ncbi:hypothetical protein ACIRD3_09965 [Kitasatospora sp. NPDC093550]|uniref:hypothetical protein n=1 Tax=Kitasatospora sp. NPDC093550 TaxID=3364089 RepID=UPI0038213ADC
MPNPPDAPADVPAAVRAAAEPLEDLLDDCNHVALIDLLPVVPVVPVLPAAAAAPGRDRLRRIAQAVYDAGPGGCRTPAPVEPFETAGAWRDVLRHEVTEGFLQPARRFGSTAPALRTPEQIRRAGELADGVADLIEAHLGPVRASAEVGGSHPGEIRWRDLLLVSGDRATVLHLGVAD